MRNYFIFFCILFINACQDKVPNSVTKYVYVSRNANYVRIDNTTKLNKSIPGTPIIFSLRSGITPNEDCLASNFYIMISICNLTPTEISFELSLLAGREVNYDVNSDFYDPIEGCPYLYIGAFKPDSEDKRIVSLINTMRSTRALTKVTLNLETYSSSVISGLKIICDKKIFGKEPGELLNEHFFLDALNHEFIISQYYQMVAISNSEIENLSINQYLSFRPFVAPAIFLKFKSVPNELPLDVCFTVEMEIDGVKKLTHTGKKVKLI